MNAKKSKNKNKSKPVQIFQEKDITANENVAKTEPVELESVKNEDSKVEEPLVVENERLVDDVPQKPKRTKGKKKKDILVEDIKHEELLKPSKHQELEESSKNYPEICTQEASDDHKKKNKNKKHKTQPIDDEVALAPLVQMSGEKDALKKVIIDPSVDISPINIEIIEQEATTQKKKKKKKNRPDPDKSDKIETQNSCTLAFQKLLQSSSHCDQEVSDSEKILKTDVDILDKTTETIIPGSLLEKCEKPQLKEIIKCEGSKPKGQNKKSKKQPPPESTEMETKESLKNVATQENIVVTDDTNSKEKCPKPKAQIAKPVEKKRKGKRNLEGSNIDSICPSLIIADESLKLTDTVQIEEAHIDNDIIQDKSVTKNVINEQDKHKETTKCDKLVSESSEISQKINDEATYDEQPEAGVNSDFSDFVKVKTGKSKKKKNKDVENHPILATVTSNLDTLSSIENPNVLSEQSKSCDVESREVDSSIIAPNSIDYPRSASQVVVDINNNANILEITTPEEIKLGIPIFTTAPLVQGTGESSEAQNNKADSNTKVAEINVKTNSPTEKTDIKSKMIEVNRDMEELRRSIERSLAELTNMENSDSNIEKDFEDIFQNQCHESKAVEIMDSVIKPVNESLSVKNIESNIDVTTGIEKTIVSEANSQLNNVPAIIDLQKSQVKDNLQKNTTGAQTTAPVCPARKDKGKGKSKRKGKQDISYTPSTPSNSSVAETTAVSKNAESGQESKNEEKSSQKADSSQEKCKKQTTELNDSSNNQDRKMNLNLDLSFEPIENFEDALTSSVDDVNKTFELIANEINESASTFQYQNNPEINIIAPVDEIEQEEKQKQEEIKKKKQTPVSQPKNFLGHTDIPVQSNNSDYKKEKHKAPNNIEAKVKIKDSVDIEKKSNELVKETENRNGEVVDNLQKFGVSTKNTNQEFVYKYNFRKVFLQSLCHLCKTEIIHRIPCQFCSIVFYCSPKHKDEDWPQHQPLCFAVSTIAHLKDQKHIYAEAKNITGQEYRVLRMQVILSCERILKRKLVPWEQEAMLYPRICADVRCREWKQRKLTDCEGCGQISYCTENQEHLPPTHQRWCKPYALYKKLVMYHQNFGKMEPRLPTKVLEHYQMTDNINEVLGSMYEEKIGTHCTDETQTPDARFLNVEETPRYNINDIQYATLTQIASASLTTVYCYHLFTKKTHSPSTNGITKKSTFTVHSIGSELQSEADSLNKWETFFLHLLTDVKELRIVFIDPNLNQSNLPLELLGKIKLCDNCRKNKRRVIFNFEDKKNYHEYYSSDDFIVPNIVCAFNPNIQRSSIHSNKDNWPSSISCILRQKIPFVVTSYTLEELKQDLAHIKRLSRNEFDVISEPKHNPFSSVRPDRNFITDHEMPLLFKNYSFSILCGA